jgi:hypothetical protein
MSGLDAGGSGESTPVRVDQMPRCRYLDPTIATYEASGLTRAVEQANLWWDRKLLLWTQSRLNSVTANTTLRSSRDEHN